MPDYRITAGTHRLPNGERAEAGDVITLSEAEGERFAFKLEQVESDELTETVEVDEPESVDEGPEPTEATDESEREDSDVELPDGATDDDVGGVETVDLPDNYSLLSKMAKHYPSEDVHGRQSGDQIRGFLSNQDPEVVANAREKAEAELSGDD
jgi:hypothetical protein